jgi:hypothetical protein
VTDRELLQELVALDKLRSELDERAPVTLHDAERYRADYRAFDARKQAFRVSVRALLAAEPVAPFAWGAATLGVKFAHVDKQKVDDWIGSDGDCAEPINPFPLYTSQQAIKGESNG